MALNLLKITDKRTCIKCSLWHTNASFTCKVSLHHEISENTATTYSGWDDQFYSSFLVKCNINGIIKINLHYQNYQKSETGNCFVQWNGHNNLVANENTAACTTENSHYIEMTNIYWSNLHYVCPDLPRKN